eukprot:563057-Rhodomonas_salina.1
MSPLLACMTLLSQWVQTCGDAALCADAASAHGAAIDAWRGYAQLDLLRVPLAARLLTQPALVVCEDLRHITPSSFSLLLPACFRLLRIASGASRGGRGGRALAWHASLFLASAGIAGSFLTARNALLKSVSAQCCQCHGITAITSVPRVHQRPVNWTSKFKSPARFRRFPLCSSNSRLNLERSSSHVLSGSRRVTHPVTVTVMVFLNSAKSKTIPRRAGLSELVSVKHHDVDPYRVKGVLGILHSDVYRDPGTRVYLSNF